MVLVQHTRLSVPMVLLCFAYCGFYGAHRRSFSACAQPMRDDVTMQRCVSLVVSFIYQPTPFEITLLASEQPNNWIYCPPPPPPPPPPPCQRSKSEAYVSTTAKKEWYEIILRPANERGCYIVTPPLIGSPHDPWWQSVNHGWHVLHRYWK